MFGLAGCGLDMQHLVWSASVCSAQGCLQLGALLLHGSLEMGL